MSYTMRRMISCGGLIIAIIAVALASGCSTTSTKNKVHQFSPVPTARVGTQELGPAQKKNASDLLRAANEEWVKGNEAQRLGDQKEALAHYSQMLQYMKDADINPAVFSGLREEFERILSQSPETADLFERDHPEFNLELGARTGRSDLFQGNVLAQQRVLAEIDDIKGRYPKNFQAGLDRSWQYRAYIEQQLTAAGLPKDLVWLAMVESLFQPTVVSRAGAGGMWQFMPSTGRRYGLRIDQYVDERRDWERATQAAVAYLQDLNQFHTGAWPLAVASYNMGEGGMSRMVAMNGGERDIWRLMDNPPAADHMPEETKKFYPKLVAYSIVATSPLAHGFKVNQTPREATTRVSVSGSYNLAALERAAGLPSGTLKRLNPALIRGVTPPSGDYAILVPADTTEKCTVALASLAKEPKRGVSSLEGRTFHVVKRGESLATIATKYGVDQRDIVTANKIRLSNRLPVGKKLLIPTDLATPDAGTQAAPDATTAPVEPKAPARKPAMPRKYRVAKGDTLYKIAMDNNVSLEALQSENKLDKHARIHVNQELLIPGAGASSGASPAPAESTTHVVAKGESLAVIAQKYDVKVDDIVSGNKLATTTIHTGDKLMIARAVDTASAKGTNADIIGSSKPPKAAAPKVAAPKAESYASYTVASGDTLSAIAARNGMKLKELRDANGLADDAPLKVGQKLKVKNDGAKPQGDKNAPKDDKKIVVALNKPDTKEQVAATSAKPAPASAKSADAQTHTVEKGQTLGKIAGMYHVKISEIVEWNNLGDKAILHVGQTLIVAGPKLVVASATKPAQKAEGAKTIHIVEQGQSPASIAKRYDVKLADLFAWNSWDKDHILHIGDKVAVFTK